MCRFFRVGIGLFLTICGPLWAQKANSFDSTIRYDHSRWKLIKQQVTTFDSTVGPANVVLLRSLRPTGTSGLGEPLSDVDLLIQQGGRVIYDFAKNVDKSTESPGTWFYMDDYLEIKHVTNGEVPQILFHSGFQGASGFTNLEHFLRYDNPKATFTDIAPEFFYNSTAHGLHWLRLPGRTLVVIADRNWPPSVPPEDQCHSCASPFQYDTYQWNIGKSTFELFRHLYGKKSYFEAGEALSGDWVLIQSGLKR